MAGRKFESRQDKEARLNKQWAEEDLARQTTDDADEQAAKASERGEKLAELDELLDEIDGVLEVNAEEFVKGYIQKGGQ